MKPNSKAALCWILVTIVLFGTLALLQYKFKFVGKLPGPFEPGSAQILVPPMPEVKEVKSEPPFKSPVLDKVLKQESAEKEMNSLMMELANSTVSICVTYYIASTEAKAFILELLDNKEAQTIFRQFSETGILIYLGCDYSVFQGTVWIDARDGVKKVAKWLATGKI